MDERVLVRLAAMIEDFDPTTADNALRDYEPAVPVTTEAFIVAGIALLLGWGATHLCAWPIRRRLGKRAAARQARAA